MQFSIHGDNSITKIDTPKKGKSVAHVIVPTNNPPQDQTPHIKSIPPVEKPISEQASSDLELLNGTSFEQLSSTDYLSFTVISKNALSFTGKLAGYQVSGTLKLSNNMNFIVGGVDVSGNLSFINNEDNIIGNVTIKESQLSHTLSLIKKKD